MKLSGLCLPQLLLALLAMATCMLPAQMQAATWVDQTPATLTTSIPIRSIWGTSETNVYAVGGAATTNGRFYKWDGTTWTEPASATFSSVGGVRTIFGFGTSELWVGGRSAAMLRSLDSGASWTSVNSGLPTDFWCRALWGASNTDIWAVGLHFDSLNAAIYRYNGSTWVAVDASSFGQTTINKVWGTAADNVFMVSDNAKFATYNGSTLTQIPPAVSQPLLSLWVLDANNILASGANASVSNGTSTSRSAFPTTGLVGTESLWAITGTSTSNLYAASADGTLNKHVLLWNGSTWAYETTGLSGSMYAIWTSPDGSRVWAGGTARLMMGTAAAVTTAPSISTPTSASITYNSAVLGGNVTSDGGSSVTARGVVYALTAQNSNPEIGGANVTNITGTGTTGVFTVNASGLLASSAYSYKAYATNSSGTSYTSVGTFSTPAAPAPEIAVSYSGNDIISGSSTPASLIGTDFGSTPVAGGQVERTFTITNSGTAVLTVGTVSATGDFSVAVQPSNNVGIGGSTTFIIRFDPTIQGSQTGVVSFINGDADESPFTFDVAGDGSGPQTFDLAGFPISNTPFDGGETYIYSSVQPPQPIDSTMGDVVTAGDAPGENGTDPVGEFDLLRRGGFLADNGYLVFPGNLEIGTGVPAVTAATASGIWKVGAGSLYMLARSGTSVPDVAGVQFAPLPEIPGLTRAGEVSFLASLVINGTTVVSDNDSGLWSELGGSGLGLLIREDDAVPGLAGVRVGKFSSGIYATATTGASTGEAVFPVTYRGTSTKTALLRASVSGSAVAVSVVAQESELAPGAAGGTFGNIAGSYTDPPRMDEDGNVVFCALTVPGSKEGIWYQPAAGSTAKVFFAGDTAPGTSGSTFSRLQRPSIGSNGYVAFRAFLTATGDNSANLRNDGIWAGDAATPGSITCILRRGDGASVVSNLPGGSLVGNVWGGWLASSNRGAWKAWLDVDGDGVSSTADGDVNAIFTNLSGAMLLGVAVNDSAPGTGGAVFSGFDLPVVGVNNQYAFLGNLSGAGVDSDNNQGLWKSGANGGALNLILRKGETINTTEGAKVVAKIDLPGSNQTDRRWEQPVMDNTGRMVLYVTFTDGSTSQILAP